jgi:hypothetical protein
VITAQLLRKHSEFYQPTGKNFDAEKVLHETSSSRQNPNAAWQRVHPDERLAWQNASFVGTILNFKRRHEALRELRLAFGPRIWKTGRLLLLMTIETNIEHTCVCTVLLEDMINNPHQSLGDLCAWMGVESSDEYLAACAKKMFSEPHLARYHIQWDAAARDDLNRFMAQPQFPYLNGYVWNGDEQSYDK